MRITTVGCALLLGLVPIASATAQQAASEGTQAGGQSAQELANKLANPVSDLVSVPLQFNWENGVGPDEG